jgi:hypothetical protein
MVSLSTHIHSSSKPCFFGELSLRCFTSFMLDCQGVCCIFSLLCCLLVKEFAEGLSGDSNCCVQVTQACQFASCLLHFTIRRFTSSINSNVGILNFIVVEACTVQWFPAMLTCCLLVCRRDNKGCGPHVADQPANDMTDALKHLNLDVPFNTVGGDTITALTTLAAIFKIKYTKPPAPELVDSPIKAAENKRPSVLIQPVLTSPIKHTYQTRS